MPISVSSQAYIFLYSVMGGAIIAFIYDVFRIKRKAIRTNSILVYIEDFVYWIIVALVMFAVVYYSNEGEIRGYILIGTLIGVVLYILLLSRFVVRVSMLVIKVVYRTLRTACTILIYPFRIIFKILGIPMGWLLKALKKGFRGARRAGRNQIVKASIWKKIFRNIRKKI